MEVGRAVPARRRYGPVTTPQRAEPDAPYPLVAFMAAMGDFDYREGYPGVWTPYHFLTFNLAIYVKPGTVRQSVR